MDFLRKHRKKQDDDEKRLQTPQGADEKEEIKRGDDKARQQADRKDRKILEPVVVVPPSFGKQILFLEY